MRFRMISLITILSFSLCMHAVAADLADSSLNGNARMIGMGGVSVSLIGENNMQVMNPAALYYQDEPEILTTIDYLDIFDIAESFNDGLAGFITSPSIAYSIMYSTRNWSIGAYSDYCLEKTDYTDDIIQMNVARLNVVEVGMAFGLGPAALGLDFRASKKSYINGRKVQLDTDLISIGTGFIQEVFLAEFTPSNDEAFEIGVGFLMELGMFTLGAYSDNVFDLFSETDTENLFDIDRFLKYLDVGIGMDSGSYTGTGLFRWAQVSLSAELKNLGDNAERTLNLGAEGAVVLSNRISFGLQLGYTEPVENLQTFLSLGSNEEGVYSAGVTTDLLFMTVSAALQVPSATLGFLLNEPGSGDDREITGKVTLGFFL